MKKCFVAFLCLIACVFSAAAEKYDALPVWQQMKQNVKPAIYTGDRVYTQRTYPDTANDLVDGEISALIDAMEQRGRPFLPKRGSDLMPAYLDVGSTIFRTGEKWMSFLTIARIAAEREQTYVDFDARVYNMESGDRIALFHLFPEESPVWEIFSQAVNQQLTAYFINETPDEKALEALCRKKQIEQTPFTLTPAKISFHYRADALYPGKNTLMHVNLYYSQIREYMTDAGKEMTDNSRYKMLALTYDDGGARGSSMNVMNELRKFGANATFFVVGTTIRSNHDVLCREHDAGYAVQSHNYQHTYENLNTDRIMKWKDRFDQELDTVIGTRPAYMRAPGGLFYAYKKAKVGLPLIQWSASSDDSGNKDMQKVALQVISTAKDGRVMLLHDLNPLAYQYSAVFLENLQKKGFLFVTVDELFSHYGVPLVANTAYYGCEEIAVQQK